MMVISSRGHQLAGHLPTRTTAPPMLRRRYTIDVFTSDWCKEVAGQVKYNDNTKTTDTALKSAEYESVIPHATGLFLPEPRRYYYFNLRQSLWPPHNSDIYIALGDSVLQNYYFNHITTLHGNESWMDDSILNTGLEALAQITACSTHHIDIVNTNTLQIVYSAAFDNAEDPGYDHIRERFQDKRWILIPINDGLGGITGADVNGTHWSLVIVDRVHKKAFYYDSYRKNPSLHRIQETAETAAVGLLSILGEDVAGEWRYLPQENSPDQWLHNRVQGGDYGACGPFVWKMCSIMIYEITSHQSTDREADCNIELCPLFPNFFRTQFDSLQVRSDIKDLISHFKREAEALKFMQEHDRAAVEGEDVVLSMVPPAIFGPPQRPVGEDRRVDDLDDSMSSQRTSESAEEIRLDDEDTLNGPLSEEESRSQTSKRSCDEDDDAIQRPTRRRHNSVESDDWPSG